MGKLRIALMLELQWLYRRHTDVFIGIQRYAEQRGNWECVVDEYVHEGLGRGSGSKHSYDGIVARVTPELSKRAAQCGIPLVNVWFNSPCAEVPSVFSNYVVAGKLAAEHLLQRGIRRFACLSARGDRSHAEMLVGYHRVLREAGHSCQCARSSLEPTINSRTWRAFQKTLDNWIAGWRSPIGVFVAYGDVSTRYVATACRRHGITIPEQAAMVAGLNEPAICQSPEPSLTGIEFGYDRVGYEAARLLESLINGEPPDSAPRLLQPTQIVARRSTDFFSHQDSVVANALQFISSRKHTPIGVQDVADAVHTSRRTLERRFRQQFGRSVAAEIRRLRIELAKRLLADTEESVKSICLRSGFSSSAQMCQVFRKFVGKSPGQFRQLSESRQHS